MGAELVVPSTGFAGLQAVLGAAATGQGHDEADLEATILRQIEAFILELGLGFALVERQKRMVMALSRAPNPAAKTAHAWLHTAKFLTTAPTLDFLPPHDLPEIAFVGRSNAGKSTCINTLTQQNQLAFASKKPGRTQHINLFSLGKQNIHDAVLADLPGYGYAAVPKQDKIRWQRVMANYLMTRQNLIGIVLLCDPRHGLTELDEILLDIVRPRISEGLKLLVLLTKSDKLTRSAAAQALQAAQAVLADSCPEHADVGVSLFSALKRVGVDEAAMLLHGWARPGAVLQTTT